jgi:rubrerythrin
MALLELALDLELSAYDLYRNLAHRSEAEAMRQTFLDLAEQEKGHARALTSAIARQSAA